MLVLTRPGFETDCAEELGAYFPNANIDLGPPGTLRISADFDLLASWPAWTDLVFARECLELVQEVPDLQKGARLQALRAAWPADLDAEDVIFYAPDSEEAKPLSPMLKTLEHEFASTSDGKRQPNNANYQTHVVFVASDYALLTKSWAGVGAPSPGGIARLKFPPAAPSRSTLKLEEAFTHLLSAEERARCLKPGMRAVDLGACPGGWTYQLVRRGIHVIAIDNGPMDPTLMRTGLVQHLRVDGFKFLPEKPVDWLVCDMVESPLKVAQLVADWLTQKRTQQVVVNFKLPMKKRWLTVSQCLELLRQAAPSAIVRCKQLYHDREEVTAVVLAAPNPTVRERKKRR